MDEKIKNYVITSILLSALVLLPLFPVRGDIDQSIQYLKTKTPNPWVTMALSAAGEDSDADYLKIFVGASASDYEAAILALVAAGKDPKSFPNENFVQKLKSLHLLDDVLLPFHFFKGRRAILLCPDGSFHTLSG